MERERFVNIEKYAMTAIRGGMSDAAEVVRNPADALTDVMHQLRQEAAGRVLRRIISWR